MTDAAGALAPLPIEATLWYDYQCPYSYRATAWLDGLGGVVDVTYRCFPLEQVNRDADADTWRLWEQPLDYQHDRGRQDRRPLAAYLLTLVAAELADADAIRRLRLAIYAARHDERRDIADMESLLAIADGAGLDRLALESALADPGALARARRQLADDWTDARSEYAVFGVPTISLDGGRPFYLRLARAPGPADSTGLLDRLLAIQAGATEVLELKLPEPIARS
jgi:2-hydroxychromene-2-carboxylate isomerase